MTSSVHHVETNDEVFPVVQTMGSFVFVIMRVPTNKTCCPDVGLMLDRRLRRRPNIKPTSGQHIVLAVIRPLPLGH